jgi:hypothetical protein
MGLPIDRSRALRTLPELRSLVDQIVNGRIVDETFALEWKTPPDVGSKRTMVEAVARNVLGMANRNPDSAHVMFEGCGYIVLGAEPGAVAGVDRLDPADVENKLSPYVGRDGPRWTWNNIDVGARVVAIVIVEAPRWGDPIHCLRRTFEKYSEGAIFIRRAGKTEAPTSAEINMLTERAARTHARLDIGLIFDEPMGTMPVVKDDPATIEKLIAKDVEALKAKASQAVSRAAGAAPPGSILGLLPTFDFGTKPETRSLDECALEIEQWADAVRGLAPRFIRERAALSAPAPLNPMVVNNTDRNFTAVRVRMEVQTPGVTLHLPSDVASRCGFPTRRASARGLYSTAWSRSPGSLPHSRLRPLRRGWMTMRPMPCTIASLTSDLVAGVECLSCQSSWSGQKSWLVWRCACSGAPQRQTSMARSSVRSGCRSPVIPLRLSISAAQNSGSPEDPFPATWCRCRESNPGAPRLRERICIREVRTDAHQMARTRTPVGVRLGVKLTTWR